MALDIFNIGEDWTSPPGQGIEPYRSPIQYPGTGVVLRNITDDIQIKFTSSFVNLTKTVESSILSFFSLHKGRQRAFWAVVPKNYFHAVEPIGANDTEIVISETFTMWLRPHERMVIVDSAGTIRHSRIVSVAAGVMTVASPLGVALSISSIRLFGRLIYCRFDQDEIILNHITPEISECELSFIELPKERLS
jgi:hypothetical protein